MSDVDLTDAVRALRDGVLDTVHDGDREPPGAEVFEAVLRSLASRGETTPGLDLALHDAVARRLAWGDSEETVLADAELVFDRLIASVERALRDPADRCVAIEAATQVAVTVARVVALAAVARAGRDRAARLREEMSHRQLRDVLDKQKATIERLEHDLKQDFYT
jgi:DNA-binding transcriptional regulator YdaS (Cro superfamily)